MLPFFGLVEIFGESGTGKTQLILQQTLEVATTNAVVYFCTEGRFPLQRLESLYHNRRNELWPSFEHILDRILVLSSDNIDTVIKATKHQIPVLCHSYSIGLIVLDSVAALFRGALVVEDVNYYKDRSKALYSIASALKVASHQLNVPVLVSNQVTDYFPNIPSAFSQSSRLLSRFGNEIVPALGPIWSSLITMRIGMSKSYTDNVAKRLLTVCFAPHLSRVEHYFEITASGIVFLD